MQTVTKESAATDTVLPEIAPDASNVPVVANAMDIQSTDNIVAVRPRHLEDDRKRDEELKKGADEIASALIANPQDKTFTTKLYALGANASAANTANISLMDQKMDPLMNEITTESSVGQSLTQIKAKLDLVNPNIVGKTVTDIEETVEKPKFLGLAIFGRKTVNQIVSRLPIGSEEVMVLINKRRDTVRDAIGTIKQNLLNEKDVALKNAIELGLIANRLAETQEELQEAAYVGQLVWAELNAARDNETDPVRKHALDMLTADLAMKVVDLQTVDQLNIQSRMGAEALINNCRGLKQLVDRVTNILLPSVATALAVKAAAAQHASLAAHSQGVMEAAGDTILSTAEGIRQTTVAVAKMNTEAMVDLDKLEQAGEQYEQMMVEYNEVMGAAEQNARGVSTRLTALNDRMRNIANPLTASRQARESAEEA